MQDRFLKTMIQLYIIYSCRFTLDSGTGSLKVWKNKLNANNQKIIGFAILISGKIDFKITVVIRDKNRHDAWNMV